MTSTGGQTSYYATRGTGGMTHADPDARPEEVFGGSVTLHVGPDHASHLLIPVIPPQFAVLQEGQLRR